MLTICNRSNSNESVLQKDTSQWSKRESRSNDDLDQLLPRIVKMRSRHICSHNYNYVNFQTMSEFLISFVRMYVHIYIILK